MIFSGLNCSGHYRKTFALPQWAGFSKVCIQNGRRLQGWPFVGLSLRRVFKIGF
jgi:hypothetical protein